MKFESGGGGNICLCGIFIFFGVGSTYVSNTCVIKVTDFSHICTHVR
jgi:hypothetical protein